MVATKSKMLVVAEPGPIRDGLLALLDTWGEVETSSSTHHRLYSDLSSRTFHPEFILMDMRCQVDLSLMVLRQLRRCSHNPQMILLADDVHQMELAKAAGADQVIVLGMPPGELVGLIGAMVKQRSRAAAKGHEVKNFLGRG